MAQEIQLIDWDYYPINEMELAQIEARIGNLPEDYRSFLLKSNGGRPRDSSLSCENDIYEELGIDSFIGLHPKYPPRILEIDIDGRLWKLLPIAKWGLRIFYLKMNPAALHHVYFWEHSYEESIEADDHNIEYLPSETDLFEIANSFSQFLTQITVKPDNTFPPPTYFYEISKSLEQICMYGDLFLENSIDYLSSLSLSELNRPLCRHGDSSNLPIEVAIMFCQIGVMNHLVKIGVKVEGAIEKASGNITAVKLLMEKGVSLDEQRKLLQEAVFYMPANSYPEENKKVIDYLISIDVKPDFKNSEEAKYWKMCIDQTYCIRMLEYFDSVIPFPMNFKKQIQNQIATIQQ